MTHLQKIQRLVYLAGFTLLILTGIVAFIIYSEKKSLKEQRDANIASRASINRLVIARPGETAISMVLRDDQWRLREPCNILINEKRLSPLLALYSPSEFNYPAAEVDLQAAGLENPLATLTLNNDQIFIGKTDLQGSRRYIQRNDQVEFAPEWILSLLEGGVTAMASTDLFPAPLTAITVIESDSSSAPQPIDVNTIQKLKASQITSYPLQDSSIEAAKSYRIETQSNGESTEWSVQIHDTFTTWHKRDSQCTYAYVVDNNVMPALTP